MELESFVKVGLVAGIIGILQGVKALDTKNKLASGFYILAAMFLGFLSGFVVTPYVTPFILWIQDVIVSGITYAGAASILYQTGKLTLSKPVEGETKIINK